MHLQRSILLSLCALFALASCKFLDPTSNISLDLGLPDVDVGLPGLPSGGYIGPDGRPALGERAGTACEPTTICRPGLACEGGVCEPTGDAGRDDGCVISGECADGLACGVPVDCLAENPGNPLICGLSACVDAGEKEEGADCAGFGECERGLRCNLIGFTGVCEPEGSSDVGQECELHSDCLDPLLCAPPSERTGTDFPSCQIPAAVANDVFMPNAECEEIPEDRPFAIFFEVPGDAAPSEFYRLPFPNDARIRNGRVDMRGHHNPGLMFIGGAFVDLYLEAAERMTGFSTNPTVFFRFTQNPDFGSIVGDGDNASIFFLNIDPESPGYGNKVAMRWSITTGRGKFICPRYVAIRPAWTSPLEHGTTYAVYFTNGVRGAEGDLARVEPDFAAMMQSSEPSDSRLSSAWQAYQPLRDYVAEAGIGPETLIAGAVFTTIDPDADVPGLREGARALDPPTLSDLTVCGGGVRGPCDDGERGACVSPSGDVIELHATYDAPIWQQGERPYLFEEDGGDIVFSGGRAVPQGTEQICLSMTIPNAPMPENGWPVVMYGHGTGGDFTSHLRDGTASRVANIDVGDGERVRFVSVSIDGPQHGPRRGGSDLSSETLFYNFVNPLTAVGNVQQGAADYFTLSYLLENAELEVPGVDVPVHFDPENMYFFGHSQGATVGGLYAAYERTLRGVIFSGGGGGLILSLLNKTSPEDIAGGVRFVLTDGGSSNFSVSDTDPLLAILQWVIDPVDPLNYARLYFRNVPPETPGLHVFKSYGYGDTYTPEETMRAFAGAMSVELATPSIGGLDGLRETPYPVSGNRTVGGEPVTAIVVPAQTDGSYDGHFVIFRNSELTRQSMEFLGTAVRDGVPTVTRR